MRKLLAMVLAAFAACAAWAVPGVLVNLDAADFVGSPMAWTNNGSLGGAFLPAGDGSGVALDSVAGVTAVTFSSRNNNSVLTNMVPPPPSITGTSPWSFEIWVYKPQTYANDEVAFTWTRRDPYPTSGNNGSCMEFRYGAANNNAVEHYGGNNNLSWNGNIPAVGQWHHVAATRDAGGMERLYLDGRLRYNRVPEVLNIRDDVGFFTLGAVMANNGWTMPFGGSIARLRIYDGTLSAKEVQVNYLGECAAFGIVPEPVDQFWNGPPMAWEDWNDPDNWLLEVVPVNGDVIFIENTGKADGYADTQMFTEFKGDDGGFRMVGGLLSTPNTVSMANGPGKSFDFQLEGGKFEITGENNHHLYFGTGNGGAGYASVGGGAGQAWLCVDKDIQLGVGNGSYGFMEVLANGLVTVSNGWFYINCNGVSTGEVVVAGGTIRGERDCRIVVGQGRGAKAKLTLNSGLVDFMSTMRMSGDQAVSAASEADVYLNGGVLCFQRLESYTGQNYFWFNGGTLRNRDGRGDFFQGLTGAYVQGGGAAFEVIPGTAVTVAQSLVEDPLSTGGGLVKLGGGTLTLTGNNTFTGDITVSEGNLFFRSADAFPSGYAGNILLENGAGIGWEVSGGAATLLSRLDPASVGTIILFGANAGDTVNLSGFPGVSIGTAGSTVDFSGAAYTPDNNHYRFTVVDNAGVYKNPITGTARVTLTAGSNGFLDMYGDSSYTGGTTILGGTFVMYHVNAAGAYRGVRDIELRNGASIMINIAFSQQQVDDLVNRITLDSQGAVFVGSPVNNLHFDLSALPGVSLGSDNNNAREYNGTLTPNAATGYHLGGGRNNWNNTGLQFKNLVDGETPRKVVLSYPGSAQLNANNNTFSGGIVVTNRAVLFFQNDASLGAVPSALVPDYLHISGGGLRPNPNVPYPATDPSRGFEVGDGGATLYPPGNRYIRWLGDLSGSGAITNQDNGTMIFGGTNNTWNGVLTLNVNNNDTTFAVGYGDAFSWVKTNVIQGNGMFGTATDLDITWSDKFEKPLGNVPPQLDAPDGTSALLGLRKLGSGTLTLDVPNTYRRETKIESGTLKVGTANAIPWGGNKGNLNFLNYNLFPVAGTLDLNGFDVNVNGLMGSGVITNSQPSVKTLIFGNNNANFGLNVNERFWGQVAAPTRLTKVGSGAQKFAKGADVPGGLTVENGAVQAGGEIAIGDVTLSGSGALCAGIETADAYGLTGEYFWFDFPELNTLVTTGVIYDLDVFEAFLSQYAPVFVASSCTIGSTFDATANGGRFQGGFNNRANHFNRWTGEFHAEVDGDYTFMFRVDDGASLFIDRQPVAVRDAMGGYTGSDTQGTIPLTAGWHDIVIGYFQAGGERGFTVYMTPPGSEATIGDVGTELPQTLLRPYPLTVASISGSSASSRVEIFGNSSLVIAGDAPSIYSGRLVASNETARLIKNGPETFTFAGQVTPEYGGQFIITDGDVELLAADPFLKPIDLAPGGTLIARPRPGLEGWSIGLIGNYFSVGNYGEQTSLVNLLNYFSGTPTYVYSTTQTGPEALPTAVNCFYYDGNEYPGVYARAYPLGSTPIDKTDFRAHYFGKFIALESGWYTFELWADDKADLFLNGDRICANAGYQDTGKRFASRYLDAGSHDFQIGWGQGGGGYFLRLYVGLGQDLPEEALMPMPNAWLRPSVSKTAGVRGDGFVSLPDPGSYLAMKIDDEAQTLNSQISGAAGSGIEKNGLEALTLTADNDAYEGEWLILRGGLIVGDGETSGTLGGNHVYVGIEGKLIFNRSDDYVYDGLIDGKGEIINIGTGRVILRNIGSDFQGVFTGGDIVISGASTLTPDNFAQAGGDPLTVHFEDGARLTLPLDFNGALPPLVFSNATVSLPYAETAAYYIDSLMVEAGGTFTLEGTPRNDLIGRYYELPDGHAAAASDAFLTLATAEAYLKSYPLFHTESVWANGDVFDYGSGDGLGVDKNNANLRFPEPVTNRMINFGAIWKGRIRITEEGDYTFRTYSDDHSMIFIDQELVVNNNGSHGMTLSNGVVNLTAGLHDFALVYAQGGGGLGLRADIALPGQAVKTLPHSMLFVGTDDIQNMTLEVGTLGVVGGPGTGTVDVTGDAVAPVNGKLLLNDLYIDAPGAVIATVGDTRLAGSGLHIIMGEEPPKGTLTKIGDFTQTPAGLPLTAQNMTIDGTDRARPVYKPDRCLYVSTSTGTLLILR